ncbi:hypothetical protein [Synechococcus sp. CCY 9618]|uniref:hypothetical protein n=1 Tax=Synechococcus sp. CCY 9618 TaxID=2815602 RepID=UPI001C24CB4B|nr:hypothetical protein [Synechococcus sp. CCY 9618]
MGLSFAHHPLYIDLKGFSQAGWLVGLFFSLAPLAGPLPGLLYLVKRVDIGGETAIAIQIVLFGFLILCHHYYNKRWAGLVSGAGALLWSLSGFFNVYSLAA